MKDHAIIELIDKWLDLRFPNADSFYRAEWHHRYEKCGIEFTIHMDGDSKHLWKKVYLEFLDAPQTEGANWIVVYSTDPDDGSWFKDAWAIFENEVDAKRHFEKIKKRDDLCSVSLTRVVQSTDYVGNPARTTRPDLVSREDK